MHDRLAIVLIKAGSHNDASLVFLCVASMRCVLNMIYMYASFNIVRYNVT